MSEINLSSLAQLLLKAHHELLSGAPLAVHRPLDVGFKIGSSRGHMHLGSVAEGLTVQFSEGSRGYRVTLPVQVRPGETPRVKIALSNAGAETEHVLDLAALFSVKLPDEFKSLHAQVLDHVKQMLPEALLRQFTSAGAEVSAPAAPAPESEASGEPESEYAWYQVTRDDQPDLRFRGKRIAAVESPLRSGRKTVFEVFQTPSGKFVGVQVGLSYWMGERNRFAVKVTETADELVQLFGYSPLAKALYAQLKVASAEILE